MNKLAERRSLPHLQFTVFREHFKVCGVSFFTRIDTFQHFRLSELPAGGMQPELVFLQRPTH